MERLLGKRVMGERKKILNAMEGSLLEIESGDLHLGDHGKMERKAAGKFRASRRRALNSC